MKRTLFLLLLFLAGSLLNQSSAASPGDTLYVKHGPRPSTLVINANVTVLLVDDERALLHVRGNERLTKAVSFRYSGDTLVVTAPLTKSLQYSGTVYVPASHLRHIHINSEAVVRSFRVLHIRQLDVVVNGACEFAIANTGRVNLTGTEKYGVEFSSEERPLPLALAFLKSN